MNEMIAFPIVVGLIIGTSFFTAVLSVLLPRMGGIWNAFITRIRRKKNVSKHPNLSEIIKRIDELEVQMDNVAKNHYKRETNRKNNIRKAVREYLEELKNGE